jgi:DNA-binding NarL/FixJ family response regulator
VNPPKVLIVDDHRVVAEGLVRLLSDRCDIVDIVSDGNLVVESVARCRPDVVLLDLSLPTISGVEAIRQLKEAGLDTKIIVLTMHADPTLAVEALKAGASGFVLKESSGEELLGALEIVLRGDKYFASTMTKEIVTLMVGAADPSRVELTIQQREVLRLLIRGLRTKEIAGTLSMSTRSVDLIKAKIMQRLNVHSTAELVRYTVENRLVPF